jgi:hypothetical protein|tara:strand:- start:836 stop:1411 length:576 start_codon:yes stop_codon:yes gene_type:complete
MSKENVLKKEFQKRDVERLRNLMTGKYGDKTRSSVGFSKKQEFYKEGDIWEADGRTWTIKDGIRQNITKLDKAKKAHVMPLLCPKCKKVMKNRNDKPFYNIHKMCFNCVIDFEHELRKEGKWDEYQRKVKNNEIDNHIKEYKLFVQEKLRESNEAHVSEAGEVERWVGKIDKDKVNEATQEVIDYLEKLKT